MDLPARSDLTRLLVAWSEGEEGALETLTPIVYQELHKLAHRYMRAEKPGHLLQTTALINEAYLRLIDWKNVQWKNRAHFVGICAGLMRRILVDFARSHNYTKRGGHALRVSLKEAMGYSNEREADLVEIDDALISLAQIDSRKSQIVEMRFFGGLSVEEIAAALHISERTVMREWSLAQAWLHKELNLGAANEC
jgi:RNA polymerase sigma factor (TIGR02999 family)